MAVRFDQYWTLGSGYQGHAIVEDTPNQSANNSSVRFRLYVRKVTSGGGYWNASGSARSWSVTGVAGAADASGNSAYDYRAGAGTEWLIADFYRTVPHNTNGSYSDVFSININHVDNPPGSAGVTPTLTLTDYPEPASGSFASSLLTATTVRLSASVTTNGNGSSSTQTFYYKKTSSGSWISAGTGSPKDLTGLDPSTPYQWRVITTNNTGNSSTGATQNFTTLPAAQAFGVFYGRKVKGEES